MLRGRRRKDQRERKMCVRRKSKKEKVKEGIEERNDRRVNRGRHAEIKEEE